jgi:hypothetical protein
MDYAIFIIIKQSIALRTIMKNILKILETIVLCYDHYYYMMNTEALPHQCNRPRKLQTDRTTESPPEVLDNQAPTVLLLPSSISPPSSPSQRFFLVSIAPIPPCPTLSSRPSTANPLGKLVPLVLRLHHPSCAAPWHGGGSGRSTARASGKCHRNDVQDRFICHPVYICLLLSALSAAGGLRPRTTRPGS